MHRRIVRGSMAVLMLIAASQAMAAAPQHMVTGNAEVESEGLVFRATVVAQRDSDGHVWGILAITFDFTDFGLGHVTATAPVTCLEVDGDRAWIGSIVKTSTNPDVIPIGAPAITLVRDLGGEGEDTLHIEPEEAFPAGTTCSDKPAILESVVRSGNFRVN